MTKYVLGLDIGITSVGYGVIDIESGNFIDYGVRLFKEGTAAENQKRRESRSHRRLLRRKSTRLEDMKKVLRQSGILNDSYTPQQNVYEIRCRGLSECLSNDELAAAILHLTKHRGSTLETVEESAEAQADAESLKATLNENTKELSCGKYICEIQLERLKDSGKVHGHKNNFRTDDYVKELNQILSNQNISEDVKNTIVEIISRRRAYYEGPGSEISPTPYGRFIEVDGHVEIVDLIEKMRGKCSLFKEEFRAPKLSVTAELFNFLNDLNNLSIDHEKLSCCQKEGILSIVSKKMGITPKQIAKYLGVSEDEISGFRIDTKDKNIVTEFKGYKKLKKILEKYDYQISLKDYEMLDHISEILTKKKGIEERREALKKVEYDFSEGCIEELANTTGFTTYHSFSFKAMRLLNEELYKTDMNQMQLIHMMKLKDDSCSTFKGKQNVEMDDEAILSPVACRAQRETFKVINALRKQYGEFDSIVIEMTRDKNSDDCKKRIRDKQKALGNLNKEVDKLLKDSGRDPEKVNAKVKSKIRLYLQQDGKSVYTLQSLDLARVIQDESYTEIDHIIPISISLDDSQNNKVLALHSENQVKGNLTPIQAFDLGKFNGMGCSKTEYVANVMSNKKWSRAKRANLLNVEDITKYSVMKEFINRNLVDTSYACRIVLNTLSEYFKVNNIDTKVHTVRGKLTDLFRRRVHFDKDRDDDYLHHAMDALIVASIKKMNLLNGYLAKWDLNTMYDEVTGELKEIPGEDTFFDARYIQYIQDLKMIYNESVQFYNGVISEDDMVCKPIKISHKIDTKPNRQIADETIYSTRNVDGIDYVVQKYKDIYDPKFTKLTDDIVNGNEQKYLMAKYDPQTFTMIKDIIMNHFDQFKDSDEYYKKKEKKGKVIYELVGENPLTQYRGEFGPVRKYSKKGNGPVISQMKYSDEKLGNHIDITPDSAKNKKVILKQISPYRTDFYHCSDGKFRFVTVRYKDVRFNKSIKKYIIDEKWYFDEKARKKVDENAEFVCSLHHDELIGIVKKEDSKYIYDASTEGDGDTLLHDGIYPEILKFTATNNDTSGTIEVKPIFKYCKKQLKSTVASSVDIKKFATDVLGNMYEVKDNRLKLEWQ